MSIEIPTGTDKPTEFKMRFKLTCRNCGSDNVVMNVESGCWYSVETQEPGSVTAGCNDCKSNDYRRDY